MSQYITDKISISVNQRNHCLYLTAPYSLFQVYVLLRLELAFDVHNILGPGLLESAYEGAMARELSLAGLSFEKQKTYSLYYKSKLIGAYIADIVVENKIILELKSVQALTAVHSAQLINYLRLSKIQVGYLINFHGSSVEWKRHAYTPKLVDS